MAQIGHAEKMTLLGSGIPGFVWARIRFFTPRARDPFPFSEHAETESDTTMHAWLPVPHSKFANTAG
jgi:hypothetical protein